ncbi:GNAT family N-acetyltransferase [Leuconostoc suionicum]|uniref:GNAT family N-acetyltransferase n=1 Tax=Leuconostoc suionicum TaxID=1511761 RepID=UPI0040353A6D
MSVYFKNTIDNYLTIAVTELSHADEIFELLDNDQENIGPFLGFVALTKTKEDEVDYIKKTMHGIADGTDALFSIIRDNHIVGVIDFHCIDSENKKAEIG